jgi:hypothetical protein
VADRAIAALRSQNKKLYLMPQNLVELWTVATRPMDVNGLGMSTAAAQPGDLFDMETPWYPGIQVVHPRDVAATS